jgi:benzoyl-CoA 2,3-dioxygenase component B
MFVGAAGVGRVVQRTVELMTGHDTDVVGPYGGFDVTLLQRYLNLHYSVSLGLFGAETSTNAANYFAAGLRGRLQEWKRQGDHRLHGSLREGPLVDGGRVVTREVPALSALNDTPRHDYVADCRKGLGPLREAVMRARRLPGSGSRMPAGSRRAVRGVAAVTGA